jgi:hypothetical protein
MVRAVVGAVPVAYTIWSESKAVTAVMYFYIFLTLFFENKL